MGPEIKSGPPNQTYHQRRMATFQRYRLTATYTQPRLSVAGSKISGFSALCLSIHEARELESDWRQLYPGSIETRIERVSC